MHGSLGSSEGLVKSLSEFVNRRLQCAGIWTESHGGKVRNMFAIKMTVEPNERRSFVLEAMYFRMVVLVPVMGRVLKPGDLTSQQMAPGVNLARTWAHMEFGQLGSEAEMLAHVDKMTERFIETYDRAQRKADDDAPFPEGYEEHCEWVRGHENVVSIRAIASNWSDGRYHLAVRFAEAFWVERRLALREPVEQTVQATIDDYREEDRPRGPVRPDAR